MRMITLALLDSLTLYQARPQTQPACLVLQGLSARLVELLVLLEHATMVTIAQEVLSLPRMMLLSQATLLLVTDVMWATSVQVALSQRQSAPLETIATRTCSLQSPILVLQAIIVGKEPLCQDLIIY
jgi:hypothetical protein